MTPDQFRSSAAWQKARARAVRGAMACADCGGPFRGRPRTKYAPSVDHVHPLALIDLGTAEGRAMAVDPGNLRVLHVKCNSRLGQKISSRRRKAPQVWSIREVIVAKRAAEGRSPRW